jgi:hypothetical protein
LGGQNESRHAERKIFFRRTDSFDNWFWQRYRKGLATALAKAGADIVVVDIIKENVRRGKMS